ncbi:hypothetical protein VSX64_11285 [Aurantimonas sp. C2-6-R+9]|uniref:hypothetical protein n=1 Tax=unclassified Aurantimonas TaxID=2638230 RepID=UPI002E195D9F|nr:MULTISPECIES: hypothetical protein [unclassified Aurantimonas]MEC5291134.1 hypothetical protein [Aurantimonas sp. C2-3-R2]MEC5324207.1 hypothetical protein [Aurantimonas sp. A3-2-R12]MEC5381461.1 hypothetical protein [Aurantimonas sp. C2-6-R+9]MEC5411904.1 hypothetical protein [Aurantimonas sp. C2-4-R8]
MWVLLEYAAWAVSASLLLWMVVDAVRVNREFDEETLMSSREGIDELLEHGDVPEARGGAGQ